MLIRNSMVHFGTLTDVRIDGSRIAALGPRLQRQGDEQVVDAEGAALLPGLRDHHLHLFSLAAARASVSCGPPRFNTVEQLAARLREAADDGEGGWIRGIGYHESVAGEIDRHWLDRQVPNRPLRVQHRSGRLWILNSCALKNLCAVDAQAGADPLERIDGKLTGRLYDADDWLRTRLGGERPSLRPLSRWLASLGVTGLTDTSPGNTQADLRHFAGAAACGDLLQELLMMGDGSLDGAADQPGVRCGPRKFHLHEHDLPDFDQLCAEIRRSHLARRGAAFHCVTRTDLVFALSALQAAGSSADDRIEHAGIAPPELLPQLSGLGVTVVTQPNFIEERGDAYLAQVERAEQPWLYRLRGFLDAGIPLAAGTDAPFGEAHPWKAMAAAVSRRTRGGKTIGAGEALLPEEALKLFISALSAPGRRYASLAVGATADLCLMTAPWALLRNDLAKASVRMTIKAGKVIWRV
jgi:predicted amidohydrolase YtcJ